MNRNWMLATTLSLTLGILSLSAPAEAILASVKTFGMAATGVAYPLDALAAAFNPAGAVDVPDRIDGGMTWSRDQGHARVHGNILDSIPFFRALLGGDVNGKFHGFRTKDFYAADFGINKHLGCCDEWAVGLVCYNRNFNKTTYSRPFVLFGTSRPGLEYLNQTISGFVAYKVNDAHNLGININCQVERLKVNGLEKFDNALRTEFPGNLTNRGYGWSVGWGFTLGWQWHILDNLTIGLTYQPRTCMPRIRKYKGFIADRGRLDVPAMYSFGIAWRFCDEITLAFDIQQYDWENVRSLHNKLLHDGELELLGSKHGPGFGFKNQTFYRFGIEYMLTCDFTVRAGFRYGNTPIPRSQTAVNQFTLDCAESFLTAGASYRASERIELSTFIAYGFKHKIKGKNSIPAGIPPLGFGGGEADLEQSKFALGVSLGYEY